MSKREFEPSALEVNAERALDVLTATGDAAPELIEQWVSRGNAAAVRHIAEHGSGAARKAARRGLNVLKSRGVAIPPSQRRALAKKDETPAVSAWMLSPDAAGVRMLAFSQALSGGSCKASVLFLRDGQGILKVENSRTSPAKLRAALASVLPGSGYDPVAVPLQWARQKVAEARRVHAAKKLPEPLGLTTAAALLQPLAEEPVEHPFDSEGFEFSDEDARELARDSGSLHHLPEFRAWLPASSAVQQVVTNVGQQLDPGNEPEQSVVTELLRAEMLAATDRYFNAELRQDLMGWMKDAGVSVLAREGEPAALKVAATIQVVGACGITENPPQDVPFLRAFFEKGVSVLMAQQGGKLSIPVPKPAGSTA